MNAADEFADFIGGVPYKETRLPWGTAQVWDVGEGRPVVAVHGISGGRRMAYRAVPAIARKRRCIVAPLRGEDVPALSRSPEPYLDDLAALLEELDLKDVTLLGVSFGGYLALGYAARNDPRVTEVIVQGGFPRYRLRVLDRACLWLSHLLPSGLGSWYFEQRALRGDEYAIMDQLVPGLQRLVADWFTKTPFASLRARTLMIASCDLTDRLDRIEAPLTLAHGRKDTIVPFRYFELLRELRPDARAVAWDDVAHNIPLTHPDRIADLLG